MLPLLGVSIAMPMLESAFSSIMGQMSGQQGVPLPMSQQPTLDLSGGTGNDNQAIGLGPRM